MHPNPRFRPGDEAAMVAQALAIGFAHIFADTPAGPMVAHAPLSEVDGALRFHLARANRIVPHLAGARILASVAGPHGYISPNWYVAPTNQVPTWNYVAIEIDGIARALDEAGLRAQLDALADAHEPRPDPWTLAKTDPVIVAKLLAAIVGFEIAVTAVRGTDKRSQNKPEADRERVVAGLRAQGNDALAAAMAAP